MKKIETIWHFILEDALTGHNFNHTQKDLAVKFDYSLSTVNHALIIPSRIGAIRKESKFFILSDFTKLLYFWSSVRNMQSDIIYATFSDEPVMEIEGLIIPESILAGYSAAKRILVEPPADYRGVYFYTSEKYLPIAKERFPLHKDSPANIFVLKAPSDMYRFGQITTLPQTFADIWNMSDWYSHDFTKALEEKINGILSQ